MKRTLLIGACLGAFFMTTAATCSDDDDSTTVTPTTKEPEIKDYTCKCTYVAVATGPNAGQPNKEETETIKAENLDKAKFDCDKQESKYLADFFDGTCLIQ